MSYLDNNYNIYADKTYLLEADTPYTESETLNYIKDMPVYNLKNEGIIYSNNKKLYFNLTKNILCLNDGVRERFKLGVQDDGKYGLKVWDEDGTLQINY